MHNLCDNFGVGSPRIYDIKKQCEKWLKSIVEYDKNKGIAKWRTKHGARSADLNKLVYIITSTDCKAEGRIFTDWSIRFKKVTSPFSY